MGVEYWRNPEAVINEIVKKKKFHMLHGELPTQNPIPCVAGAELSPDLVWDEYMSYPDPSMGRV